MYISFDIYISFQSFLCGKTEDLSKDVATVSFQSRYLMECDAYFCALNSYSFKSDY